VNSISVAACAPPTMMLISASAIPQLLINIAVTRLCGADSASAPEFMRSLSVYEKPCRMKSQ